MREIISADNARAASTGVQGSAGRFLRGESAVARLLWGLILCLLFLPFLNKAFHIDDAEFLIISRIVEWNPLHTAPVDYPTYGQMLRGSLPAFEMTHPLLVPYMIKLVSAVFGEREVILHLAFLIFPALALWSVVTLNRMWFPEAGSAGRIVALFLCSIPVFLVSAHTIMTDVPTLAFILFAMALYSLFAEKGSVVHAYLGGAALCLAAFTSYQALFFVFPVFIILLMRRRFGIHGALSLLMPVAALLAWFLLLYHTYDIFPMIKGGGAGSPGDGMIPHIIRVSMDYENSSYRGISILAFIGASMLFITPAYCILSKSRVRLLAAFMVLFFFGYAAVTKYPEYSVLERLSLGALVALGMMSIGIACAVSFRSFGDDKHRGGATVLLLWIFLVLTYSMLLLPFVAARHILPIFPPLVMLLVNGIAWEKSRVAQVVVTFALFCSALFGAASAFSDYEYAGTYREIANDVGNIRSGSQVWYIGKWGMEYYMNKAGGRYLMESSNEPRKGDIIVIPEMPRFWNPSLLLQSRLALYAEKICVSPLPLRLFNGRSNAGFYSSGWGLLPFAFSSEPDEVFGIYRVVS